MIDSINKQILLSQLWLFMLLNMVFRDIHEFFSPGTIQEAMTGVFNGVEITESLMLIGGFMVEIPILMVLVSRLLKRKTNRWLNLILAPLNAVMIIQNGVRDMDDIFFVILKVIALTSIFIIALRWKEDSK